MAKIIKKGPTPQEEFENGKVTHAKNFIPLCALIFICAGSIAFFALYYSLRLSVLKSLAFAALIGFLPAVLTFALIFLRNKLQQSPDELIYGEMGEAAAGDVLELLPDNYYVFRNVSVTYEGKTSEIDDIVVGSSGVFIVEVKNRKGTITGRIEDKNWKQTKVGRGGKKYFSQMYSPVKQIGTHIYRYANVLRAHGFPVRVEGAVFFADPNGKVKISGKSDIKIFSNKDGGDSLLSYILSGKHNLSPADVEKIADLTYKL